MKTKMYCKQCAFGNLYRGPKPKFCQNCGVPLSIEAEVKRQIESSAAELKHKVQQNDPNEEDDEDVLIISLEALEVEIDNSDWQTHSVKMGQAVGTSDSEPKSAKKKRARGRPPKHDKQKFLEEFQREAGAKRPNKAEE